MFSHQRRNRIVIIVLCLIFLFSFSAWAEGNRESSEIIRPAVVVMSLFEIGEMAGDAAGEAQSFYEAYFSDPAVYELTRDPYGCKLYVENGVGLCLLGQGKSASAVNATALLSDSRFDFSDTVFLLSGCAGSAKDFGVAGDVYVITAAVDYEIGHTADIRDLEDKTNPLWYRGEEYDPIGCHLLNPELVDFACELLQDFGPQSTASARACMARNFGNDDWAVREPKVLKGTSVTADNYWKGEYNHQKAVYMSKEYNVPDPYAATVMEDSAVALAFQKMGLGDHLLILRSSVNMDVFLDNQTPESLWQESFVPDGEEFDGFDDIFPVAMQNSFQAGKIIIDEILENGCPVLK